MSIIMDRISDLGAVDWANLPYETLSQWEVEALHHDKECRCAKCALLFARLPKECYCSSYGCAISDEVIAALRDILDECRKIQ